MSRAVAVKASSHLRDYYRGVPALPSLEVAEGVRSDGYFSFGHHIICYGRVTGEAASKFRSELRDVSGEIGKGHGSIVLPFDPDSVVENLRYERYVPTLREPGWMDSHWVRSAYYRLRPFFPVGFRSRLQKRYLMSREDTSFPRWPVDRTVDAMFERLLGLALEELGIDRVPFIWFWPDGYRAAAIVTHDVETAVGRDFCRRLIEVDDGCGIRSSFQIVPEVRYEVPEDYLQMIRESGCEINIHGLDHSGNLFENRQTFLDAAEKINNYAVSFGATGFRSPVLYRKADWFQDLNFSYDMSFPSVAQMEAQGGGCCTVMPYFLPGRVLELPLTTTEDYTLFHVLNDYSTDLWRNQIRRILDGHGLITILTHPDYVIDDGAMNVYQSLLDDLARLRAEEGVWCALPGEVDAWWRVREDLTLVCRNGNWEVEGRGADRARVGWAHRDGSRIICDVE